MALPSLSHSTPRESPTLATVSSLSDSRATRHVVPEAEREGRVVRITWIFVSALSVELSHIYIR